MYVSRPRWFMIQFIHIPSCSLKLRHHIPGALWWSLWWLRAELRGHGRVKASHPLRHSGSTVRLIVMWRAVIGMISVWWRGTICPLLGWPVSALGSITMWVGSIPPWRLAVTALWSVTPLTWLAVPSHASVSLVTRINAICWLWVCRVTLTRGQVGRLGWSPPAWCAVVRSRRMLRSRRCLEKTRWCTLSRRYRGREWVSNSVWHLFMWT